MINVYIVYVKHINYLLHALRTLILTIYGNILFIGRVVLNMFEMCKFQAHKIRGTTYFYNMRYIYIIDYTFHKIMFKVEKQYLS